MTTSANANSNAATEAVAQEQALIEAARRIEELQVRRRKYLLCFSLTVESSDHKNIQ